MEDVPVKIAENYKPPPRVYQVPQSIANKLQLPASHYHEAPQFTYDFQLERKVRAKVPEWQRMRRTERDARRERKEKRDQQRLRDVEAQHKQLLGAVSYPSAEELSSSEDEESEAERKTKAGAATATKMKLEHVAVIAASTVAATQTSSFHNILQPTIVTRSSGSGGAAVASVWNLAPLNALTTHTERKNCDDANILSTAKHSNVFNYKDFEDDTSSPFDNIELKTINDLDILAQVLHNTQLKARADQEQEQQKAKENTSEQETDQVKQVDESEANFAAESNESNLTLIENTRAALERVDFNDLCRQLQQHETDIPTNDDSNKKYAHTYTPTYSNQLQQQQQLHQEQQQPAFISYTQQYSNFNMPQAHPPIASATFTNQNYLYTANCNGISAGSPAVYYSPTHAYSNANTYLSPSQNFTAGSAAALHLSEADLKSKSKSVPDIIRELSIEVRNAEMRRSRNYSHNLDDGRNEEVEAEATAAAHKTSQHQQQQTPIKVAPTKPMKYYAQLEAAAQMLAKNISHMGFPLERVAKIAQMFGADDKKIIEHLIPLSELMDLGFDETKISEALMKFDNNKEKALEYLIS